MDQAARLRALVKEQVNNNSTKKLARVITITSGKGGVGKTSTSVNLAIQLKKLGYSVIILDADFGLANIEVLFGIIPKYNLSDMIFKGKDLEEIITTGPLGIEFISSGTGIQELTELTSEQLSYLIKQLETVDHLADFIIIDTGAGISKNVLEFVLASNEVLIVTTPEPTSITDSYALLKAIKKNNAFHEDAITFNIITNRVNSQKSGEDIYNKLNLVSNKFLNINMNFLGYIPQDNHVQKAVMNQKPFSIMYPSSQATKAIESLAQRIISMNSKTESNKGMTGFFKKFIKLKLFK